MYFKRCRIHFLGCLSLIRVFLKLIQVPGIITYHFLCMTFHKRISIFDPILILHVGNGVKSS